MKTSIIFPYTRIIFHYFDFHAPCPILQSVYYNIFRGTIMISDDRYAEHEIAIKIIRMFTYPCLMIYFLP